MMKSVFVVVSSMWLLLFLLILLVVTVTVIAGNSDDPQQSQSQHHQSKPRRKAYLIFNPISGYHGAGTIGGSSLFVAADGSSSKAETSTETYLESMKDLETIKSWLQPHMDVTVVLTQENTSVVEQTKQILNDYRRVHSSMDDVLLIASGGDGTVGAVASTVMKTNIPIGIIPRGTGNAFSQALQIPIDSQEACETIIHGVTRKVDASRLHNNTSTGEDINMILLAGLGFEAGMVDKASREWKDELGQLAYVLGGVAQTMTQQPFICDITVDNHTQYKQLSTTGITIANVAPSTSISAQGFGVVTPDDGCLDVTISTAQDQWESLQTMADLMTSAVTQQPTVSDTILRLRAKQLHIKCNELQRIVVDGEMMDIQDMTFQIVPHALAVIVPPGRRTGRLPPSNDNIMLDTTNDSEIMVQALQNVLQDEWEKIKDSMIHLSDIYEQHAMQQDEK